MVLHALQLFNGRDFVLHHHAGTGDILLITFVGTHHEHQAEEDYLLRDYVEFKDLPCLAITCKTRNFYTSSEMDSVIEKSRAITERFGTVLIIGSSIGGYGALKFSRRLNATHVLAVVPAYSFDFDELNFDDPGQRQLLEEDLRGHGVESFEAFRSMGIKPDDVAGKVTVIHNPNNRLDCHQMTRMRQAISFEELSFAEGGHDIFRFLEKPEIIGKTISLILSDETSLKLGFKTIKREIPMRTFDLLTRALPIHPLLVHRALLSRSSGAATTLRSLNEGRFSLEVAYHLAINNYKELANERIDLEVARQTRLQRQTGRDRLTELPNGIRDDRWFILLSAHGTLICGTSGTHSLLLSPDPFLSDDVFLLFANIRSNSLTFFSLLGDGSIVEFALHNQYNTQLLLERLEFGVSVRADTGFISAHPNQSVTQDAAVVNSWEIFVPVYIKDPKLLTRKRNTDWLESSQSRAKNEPTMNQSSDGTSQPVRRGILAKLTRLIGIDKNA